MNQPLDEKDPILGLEARRRLYKIVVELAGSHLREIQRASGLSFGTVSYHLSYLRKHNLIREQKDGNTIRYFPLKVAADEKLLILLRQRTLRKIILFVFDHPECTHQEIVESVKLSPSTVTWHLKKLLESGLIKETKNGKFKNYSLTIQKERIIQLLITYRESFIDSLVDNVIEMWEGPEFL